MKFFCGLCAFFGAVVLFSWGGPPPASARVPLEMPGADRLLAQKYLFQAYEMYTKNRFPEALAFLNRAIEEDTYLLDYYLLRCLVLRRMGDFESALREMDYYLEVRPGDTLALRIRKNLRDVDAFLDRALSGTLPLEKYVFTRSLVKNLQGLRGLRPGDMAGAGKISLEGERLFLPDTLGNRLWVMDLGGGEPRRTLEVPSPVCVLPLGKNAGVLLSENGEVHTLSVKEDALEKELLGTLENVVLKDGAFLSASLMLCADWGHRRLLGVSYPELEILWEWAPSRDPVNFAPVGLDVCGDVAALADGAGERVMLFDPFERKVLEVFPLESPVDVCWTSWGSLCAVDARGEVWLGPEEAKEPFRSVASFPGAWSLSRRGMGLLFSHVGGEVLWFGDMRFPENFDLSLFWLQFPRYDELGGQPRAFFQGGICYPGAHLFPRDASIFEQTYATGLWMDVELEGRIDKLVRERRYTLAVGGEAGGGEALSLRVAPGALFEGLQRVAREEQGLPGALLLDPGMPLSSEERKRLLGYVLFNGISLHLQAGSAVPSPALARIARLSGGREFLLSGDLASWVEQVLYSLSFMLPQEMYPSGYPGKSIFSLFLENMYCGFRDWIPFWPAGFQALPLEAVPQN